MTRHRARTPRADKPLPVKRERTDRRIDVEPLDPNSPKGREVAARLSVTFAEVREAIAMRQAREAAQQQQAP